MSPELKKLLLPVCKRLAKEFKESDVDTTALVEEWEDYGYEDLDEVTDFLNGTVSKSLAAAQTSG